MDDPRKLEEKIRLVTTEKNKYLTIFESLPNPVILADEKNQFEYMNHAAALLFENSSTCGARYLYQADEGIEMLPHNLTTGSVDSCLPWLDDELATFARGPELTCSFEKAILSETGHRNYAVRFSRMQDISSKFLGTVIILEDITEKKQAEDALRLSEERFRSIFESATDSILVWDKDYNYLYANQAAIEHVGATRDKVIGKNIRDGLGHLPNLMQLWMERVDRVFDSGQPMRVEDAVEVGAKFVYSESVLSPIKDTKGNMFAVGVLYRDVTERKKMERRIAEALDLNQKIISVSSLGIAAYHSNGQCVFANRSAARIVGATEEKFLQQNFNSIESWKKSGLLKAARQVLSDGNEKRLEIHTVSSFDRDIWLDCQLTLFTTAGESHLLLIIDDITDRKEMENKLRQQNVALEDSNQELERASRRIIEQQTAIIEEERLKVLLQMAGATAHELNQPLMALLGYIELMAMDRDDPEKVGKYSEQIENAGRRIAEIVKKIQTIRHDEVKRYAGETTIMNLDKPVKILSVEDNDLDYQKIITTIGHSRQIQIERAEDIDVAFERLEDKIFDLIFVDYALPSGNALDFMAMMEEKQLEIPVVVITGKGDEMIASQVIQCGAYDYLPKSKISKKSLARIIHNTMEKFRMKTEIKQAMEKMAELSTKDELTDLYNRRYFMESAEREVSGTARYGQDLSLLMLDLDFFKQVNDNHGHPAGDAVLKQTAGLLKKSIRKYDVACRYGGEEFAVIMPNTRLADAQTFCERLRKKVENTTVRYDSKKIRFTVSIGIAQFLPEIDKSISDLIKRADDRLYSAKQQGRNRVVAFDEDTLQAVADG
jgi:two-component system cell cycle response regulator